MSRCLGPSQTLMVGVALHAVSQPPRIARDLARVLPCRRQQRAEVSSKAESEDDEDDGNDNPSQARDGQDGTLAAP